MKGARDFVIFDRRYRIQAQRRLSPAELCAGTYRPLLAAIVWSNRLLQVLFMLAAIYLILFYRGYEMKVAGFAYTWRCRIFFD